MANALYTKVGSNNHYDANSAGFVVANIGTYDAAALYFVVVSFVNGTPPTTTVSDAGSGVWTQGYTYGYATGSDLEGRIFKLASGTPSGDVSVAFSGAGAYSPTAVLIKVAKDAWAGVGFVGYIPSSTTGQENGEVSLHEIDTSPAAAGAGVIAVNIKDGGGDSTSSVPATGWTEIHEFYEPDQSGIAVQYSDANTGDEASFDYGAASPFGFTVGLEFEEEAGGVTLVVADATHAHAADGLTLTDASPPVQDSGHSHVADSPTLTGGILLTVADALQGHAADGVALTQANTLAIADALQAHAADNVTLTVVGYLTVADALHGHTSENVVLTQAQVLAIADAVHAHLVENIGLHLPGVVGGSTRHCARISISISIGIGV